jgi:hypothetical protein
MDGVSHTVEITAATLYEAVAQGLAAIRGNEWVAGIAQGHNVVRVSVADVSVEHTQVGARPAKVGQASGRHPDIELRRKRNELYADGYLLPSLE